MKKSNDAIENLFKNIWKEYTNLTPQANDVLKFFTETGNTVINDHIAYRTLNDKRVNIDKISQEFINLGYIEGEDYNFIEKKLYAKHFYHPTGEYPKIFISELILEQCSEKLQHTMRSILDQINFDDITPIDFLTGGRLWDLGSYDTYQKLVDESEYASWFYVHGYVANHFTVNVNKLDKFKTLQEVNQSLMDNGFNISSTGGMIKGCPTVMLEQSSTLADKIHIQFDDNKAYSVPSCFYEFAYRYKQNDGNLFQGFVTASANKIFESTNITK